MNYEEFLRNFTNEEQKQLLKYLPGVDTAKLPDRLESISVTCVFDQNFIDIIIEYSFDVLFCKP